MYEYVCFDTYTQQVSPLIFGQGADNRAFPERRIFKHTAF